MTIDHRYSAKATPEKEEIPTMSKPKIQLKKFGSVKELERDLASGGSHSSIWGVPADGIRCRFLQEPDDFFGFFEFWSDDAEAYAPMVEGERLPDGARKSFRYVANVIDMDEDRVLVLKMPKTVVSSLMVKYDRYGTITDRDYWITRSGKGMNTSYEVDPDEKSKVRLEKYEPQIRPLEDVLVEAREAYENKLGLASTVEDDDDDVEEEPTTTRKRATRPGTKAVEEEPEEEAPAKPARATRKQAEPVEEEIERDEDVLFPDGDYRYDYSRAEIKSMDPEEVAELLDWWELEHDFVADEADVDAWEDAIKAILEAQAAVEDEDDDEEEPEEDDSDDEDDDDEADEEEIELDEDELREMSIKELRVIAKELDIKTARMSKDAIVDAIIEAAEE